MKFFDEIKEYFKDRLTSPLFSSFILTWLLINWRIPVAFISLDNSQLKYHTANDIIEFIEIQKDIYKMFWYPLALAIFYTFLYPLIKYRIDAIQVYYSRLGTEWNLKASKGGKIDINKYIELSENLKTRTKQLQKVIEDESEYRNKNAMLDSQLIENKTKIDNLEFTTDFLKRMTDVKLLNGKWNLVYSDVDGVNHPEQVFIEDGMYNIVDKQSNSKHYALLRNFQYDPTSNKIFFVKEFLKESGRDFEKHGKFLVNYLTLSFDGNSMTGIENIDTKVEYIRKNIIKT